METSLALEADDIIVEESDLPVSSSSADAHEAHPATVRRSGPYVLAFSHQKGGVAKTTSSAALAAILAAAGYRVLAVDLDPTANLTASFGINPARVRHSAADILLGNEAIPDISVRTQVRGLDLLPSNTDMTLVARFLYLRPRFEYLLRAALAQEAAVSLYDYVLVDCPPALASLATTALTAANLVVIPIQCEYYSLQALDAMFKSIQRIRTQTNPYLCFRLLVVMFDARGSLHKKVFEMIQKRYQGALFETVIGFDTKLREAQLAGIPIPVFAPHARATQQYQLLVQELTAYVEKQSNP
ncbi:MAG: ParA family protein [Chloroflexota bacterium]